MRFSKQLPLVAALIGLSLPVQARDAVPVLPVVVCATPAYATATTAQQRKEALAACGQFARAVFSEDMSPYYGAIVHRTNGLGMIDPAGSVVLGLVDRKGERASFAPLPSPVVITPQQLVRGCDIATVPLDTELGETPASRCLSSYKSPETRPHYALVWEVLGLTMDAAGTIDIDATLWMSDRRTPEQSGTFSAEPVGRSLRMTVERKEPWRLVAHGLRELFRAVVLHDHAHKAYQYTDFMQHVGGQSLVVACAQSATSNNPYAPSQWLTLNEQRYTLPPGASCVSALTGDRRVSIDDMRPGVIDVSLGIGKARVRVQSATPFVDDAPGARLLPEEDWSMDGSSGLSHEHFEVARFLNHPSTAVAAALVLGGVAATSTGGFMVHNTNQCIRTIDPVRPLPEAQRDYDRCVSNAPLELGLIWGGVAAIAAGAAIPVVRILTADVDLPLHSVPPTVQMGVKPSGRGALLELTGTF